MDTGFNIAGAVGRCWDAIPAIASATLSIEVFWLFVARLRFSSSVGKVVSRGNCSIICCGCVDSRWVGKRQMPREDFRNFWWGVLSCHHEMSVRSPVNDSFVDRHITSLYGDTTTGLNNSIQVCERVYLTSGCHLKAFDSSWKIHPVRIQYNIIHLISQSISWCRCTCEPLTCIEVLALFQGIISSAVLSLSSSWVPWLLCPIMRSDRIGSDSVVWPSSL